MRQIMFVFLFGSTFILAGCGAYHVEGIIIDASDTQLLVAQNITVDEYEEIRHKSPTDIQNEDVHGIGPHLSLMYVTYDKAADFIAGDVVHIWLTGDIMESYPSQATAKKVKLAE